MQVLQVNKKQIIRIDFQEIVLPVIGGYYKSYYIAKNGATCVDGRTSDLVVKQGLPAVYGGDLSGLLANFEYMFRFYPYVLFDYINQHDNLTKILDFIHEIYLQAHIKFYLHTDDHALEQNGIGCGHFKINYLHFNQNQENQPKQNNQQNNQQVKENQNKTYNFVQFASFLRTFYSKMLDLSIDVTDIFGNNSNNKSKADAVFIKEVLHGDHLEQAVVIINSTDFTLTRKVDLFKNVFVYNQAYAKEVVDFQSHVIWHFFEQNQMIKDIESLNEWQNNVWNIYQEQVQRTNDQLVKPKGLPIYQVEVIT